VQLEIVHEPLNNPAFQGIVKLCLFVRHKSHHIWETSGNFTNTRFNVTVQIAILLRPVPAIIPCSFFKGAQLRSTMSSNDAAVGLSPLSRDASQHSLSNHPLEAIKDLIDDVRLLASKESFTEVKNFIAENASLRDEVKTRVDETKKLTSQIEALKVNSENRARALSDSYDKTHHEILRIHHESVSKVEAEMMNLRTQISALEKKLEEETTKTTEIQKLNQELEQRNVEYASQCEEGMGKVAQAENKLQELQAALVGKDKQIEKHKENHKKQELDILSLGSSLGAFEEEKQSLTRQLEKSERKLKRIDGFTQDLFDDDLDEA
jgi:chromosome segregation ATPase